MPYEDSDRNSDDFAEQLLAIEQLSTNNLDCHITIGRDFKVDFSRTLLHYCITG